VLETPAPEFSASAAERAAREHFGVAATASLLVSERDQNFHLRAEDGRELVLKIANPAEDPTVLDFHNQALLHIASIDPDLPVPKIVPTTDGVPSCLVQGEDGRNSITRLLTFLPGRLLDDATLSPPLLRDVGAIAARLARALRGFFHPAARHTLLWDLQQAPALRSRTRHIENAAKRGLAEETLDRFEALTIPALRPLRAQVIHNDVSCKNTLVDVETGDRVVGVIDFGDTIHAPLVNDLAVPIGELMSESTDPIGVAMEITAGYHAIEPLREEEVEVVFDLVKTRLATSVIIAAWRSVDHPENIEYIVDGVDASCSTLEWLNAQDPEFLRGRLREACGFPAPPNGERTAS